MKRFKIFIISAAVAACMAIMPVTAFAHGAWFAKRSDRTQLVVGEGWKDNSYNPKGLLKMIAYNSSYMQTDIKSLKGKDYIYIEPKSDVSVVYVELDYGYWSNTPEGKWVPYPMDKVKGSTVGTHAIKYSVNYLGNVDKVKPLDNMLYQLVPSVDPTKLKVGEKFTVQLLHNGKPMANVKIIPDVINHHTEAIKTDKNGIATVEASNGGVNVIGCEMEVPYENEGIDNKATRSKVFVSLSFTLYPEEED